MRGFDFKEQKLLALLMAVMLSACGGGGGASSTSSTPVTTVGTTGGSVATTSDGTVLAVPAGFMTGDTQPTITTSSASYLGLDSGATQASKTVSVYIDPSSISDTAINSQITIYLPLTSSSGASAAPLALPLGDTYEVVKIKLGNTYHYMKATAYSAAKVSIQLPAEILRASGGTLEAVVQRVQYDISTPDGKLFSLNGVGDAADASQVLATLPTGKIPLVLVHGIQSVCKSEVTAYQSTWTKFIDFFYNDAAAAPLRTRFKLYSFAYRTDQHIANNGTKFKAQLLTVFGTTKVTVLAHSMGGLVARYADTISTDGLQGLLTLNTPHHGTTEGIILSANQINELSQKLAKSYTASAGFNAALLGSSAGIYRYCQGPLSTDGASSLRWDYFDADVTSDRCTNNSNNGFLCANLTGLNQRPVPARMYMYSGVRGSSAAFTQAAAGLLLQANNVETMMYDDGDVPVASQQYQIYSDLASDRANRYSQRTDAWTAPIHYDTDHVQIHDERYVFTTKGVHGTGLIGDLIALAANGPTIGTQPAAQTVTAGQTATFGVIASGGVGVISYQWKKNGNNISGATSSSYTTLVTANTDNGAIYSVAVTNASGTTNSSAALLTVGTPLIITNAIPDTGITASQCYAAGSDALVSCTSAAAIALSPTQDGMLGRDVTSASNTDGKLGFSYSTVGSYSVTECVKDNITGLIWEGKPASGTRGSPALNPSSTYTNYDNNSGHTAVQINATSNAQGYINSVNAVSLCGYSDWRLPTAKELQSIVDYGAAPFSAWIDGTWFPSTIATFGNSGPVYWTSSLVPSNPPSVWHVNFGHGGINYSNRADGNGYVRLVRGATSLASSYTYSMDGAEVTDSVTGLVWRRCTEGQAWSGSTCTGIAATFTHDQALVRASSQAVATSKAWRIPNIKELSSVTQWGASVSQCIDANAFPATPTSAFWSSSPRTGNGTYSWSILFSNCLNFVDFHADSNYVRLVR